MNAPKLTIPHNYKPRTYQLPVLTALDDGKKRAVIVWHRRAGKDKTILNYTVKKMIERVGTYYYFFPTYNQGKKILWDGMDKEGYRFLNHIPEEIRKSPPNETEMQIELTNNSIFQIIGTDKIDSIVGTNPIGCVFSEYSLQDPAAWDYIRPILAENGGWAVFCFTPRGENHGYKIYNLARQDPAQWYSQVLTVDDTKAIPQDVLDNEHREIIQTNGDDALFQQEYYCNFTVPIAGSYYTAQIQRAYADSRVREILHLQAIPVNTWWDIGVGDSTAIWFTQTIGQKIYFIDYLENTGKGLDWYIKELQNKSYIYGKHNAPHDIEVREFTNGKSRLETARGLGINFRVVPRLGIDDGIHAARQIFDRCYFDSVKCERGLNALKNYQKKYDETRKTYSDKPDHTWASHAADAFRMFAVGFRDRGTTVDEQDESDATPQLQFQHRGKGY